ncbi:TetR/AcrR family transcriptional regulator [Paractinoplanes rhizophilus]|jgi:AcrR family transcriptional regulator|uniref:TetR/AcrR family transcriptional regulator n=1 Tax=Paractinoplanes rhizophilus TaxID=1416877 RepID=A0ABW2I4G5_9ACTN|nr:helix-turn-helix domain-containing protein [Actinoplanes sp.]
MRALGEADDSLLFAAAETFGRQGYAATSVDEVARLAGVGRGAVHHRYGTKSALFRSALVFRQRRLAERFVSASSVRIGWDALRAGCAVMLDAYRDAGVRRMLLIDGPAVLGPEQLRAVEDAYVGDLLRRGLQQATGDRDVEARLSVLRGALAEAGLLLARDPAALGALEREIESLLDAFQRNPAPA